ncbi:MAG: ComEA family DNA-binding protein [Buchananella hordeovulneris]|nr:ComEA family DNA-binding protein [Buchananella hordeovulneris]
MESLQTKLSELKATALKAAAIEELEPLPAVKPRRFPTARSALAGAAALLVLLAGIWGYFALFSPTVDDVPLAAPFGAPRGEAATAGSQGGQGGRAGQEDAARGGAGGGNVGGKAGGPGGGAGTEAEGGDGAGDKGRRSGARAGGRGAGSAGARDEAALGESTSGEPGQGDPGQGGGAQLLAVHVAGAVVRPGVYLLAPGSRVVDALTAAGGPTAQAEANAINLARPVQDGERIVVPLPGQVVEEPGGAGGQPGAQAGGGDSSGPAQGGARQGSTGQGGAVNINAAGAAELETLPGIGPALAQRIVSFREEHGEFSSVEQLQNVPGIGPAKFAAIAQLVRVR